MVAIDTTYLRLTNQIIFMKTENEEILQMLDLTEIESKTYLTLLDIGTSKAGTISNRAHIHRRNTYDALENLLQKGLVTSFVSNNQKFWAAVNPKKLYLLLKEKEYAISKIMPELISNFNSNKGKQIVEVFEGLGGMKTFFDDMANSKKDVYMLFATGRAYLRMKLYMESWDKRINNSGIKVRVLLNSDAIKEPYQNYKYGEIKILQNTFSPTQIFIYGNKTAIAIWSDEPIAALITSNEITKGFKKYFGFLWKFGKRVHYNKI